MDEELFRGEGIDLSRLLQLPTAYVATWLNATGRAAPAVDTRKSLIFSRFQILLRAGEVTRVYPLPESGAVSIGRERQNHICIDDPAISLQHASLHLFQDRVEICDLASAGGTWLQRSPAAPGEERGDVGAERLVGHARVSLTPGDVLSIGGALLSLQSTAGAATAPPAPPAPLEADTDMLRAPELAKAYALATRAAATELSVLILGETGCSAPAPPRSCGAIPGPATCESSGT